jgi:hypothetical protein
MMWKRKRRMMTYISSLMPDETRRAVPRDLTLQKKWQVTD